MVGGGMQFNDLSITGGTVEVLDQDPPAGEDPVLDRSIVGGYLRDGAIHVTGGTITSPNMKLGITAGDIGSYTQTGGTVSLSYFGVGNNGTFNNGLGKGIANISGGTLRADTIILGSTAGGSGDMVVSGSGQVIVGGGFMPNDLTVNGGAVTVLDQDPPAGEDPVLNRSIAAGYQRDGAVSVNGGTVSSPFLKLGVTSGHTGTYTQSGGTVNVGTVLLGSAAGGIGSMTVSGGSFSASSLTRIAALGQLRSSAAAIALGNLQLLDGGNVLVDSAGASRNVRATSISIDTVDASFVDLSDNTMHVTGGTSYAQVASYIASARSGGSWNGAGLTSSTAAAATPKNKTLGALTGAQFLSIYGTGATFAGDAVGAADVLVKFTYNGDTDFNGTIDFDDYSRTDNGFNNGGTGWFQGDFDYNGRVDFDDYSLIDMAFNTQSGTLRRAMSYLEGGDRSDSGMDAPSLRLVADHFQQFGNAYASSFLNAVPEPGCVMLSAALPVICCRRRRHASRHPNPPKTVMR
jgi:hypothetical protein